MKKFAHHLSWRTILIGGIGLVGLLLNAGLVWYVQTTLASSVTTALTAMQAPAQPVTKNLPLDTIASDQVAQLSQGDTTTYLTQVGNTPDTYPNPVLPNTITVADTKVGNSVLVSWQALVQQTIDGVNIYRSTSATTAGEKISTVNSASGSYLDSAVVTGSTYYYQLEAVRHSQGGETLSPKSNVFSVTVTDAIPPTAPTPVTVTRATPQINELIVSWPKVQDVDIAQYYIYRSTQDGKLGAIVVKLPVSTITWTDDKVDPGVSYYYTVTAVDAAGNESPTRLTTASAGNAKPFVVSQADAIQQMYGQ